jgi:lipopolysaccharide transport system ATP-binding protein
LSGRENIYLTGTILGMNTREIRQKLEAIVDFAELDDFIDAPVATYSSGMRVRLGFSVAIHLDPQLLFIDEVLAVGDQAFKRKAEARIKALIASGISVVFVSHNLTQVVRLCDQVMHLEHGKVKNVGDAQEVVAAYMLESKPELSDVRLDHLPTFSLESWLISGNS